MLRIDHIIKYNNKYNNIVRHLYFYREYFVKTCYYLPLVNIIPNCDICNMSMQTQTKYSSKDNTVNGFSLCVCINCYHGIKSTNRLRNIIKHYGLITLLSQQLLINYLPKGYIIPQISNLIIKDVINININSHYMLKYKI